VTGPVALRNPPCAICLVQTIKRPEGFGQWDYFECRNPGCDFCTMRPKSAVVPPVLSLVRASPPIVAKKIEAENEKKPDSPDSGDLLFV
jgi:hypothetical protein